MIAIYVRPDEIPDEWKDKADKLTKELLGYVDDPPGPEAKTAAQKRKGLIDAHQEHWRELKEVLLRWSSQKCWYSELRDDGSDYHVDHFRPKGRVRNPGEPERDGYWWLAFEWRNYRAAVAWCNSPHLGEDGQAKGKHDQFPLGMKGRAAACPSDSLDDEDVVLLDPVNADDVALIDFDETGVPIATADGWTNDRVTTTVKVLHLDSPRMKEARQRVWRDCERRLGNAHKLINQKALDRGSLDGELLKATMEDLRSLMRPDAELSAVARACVQRSGYKWAFKLLAA